MSLAATLGSRASADVRTLVADRRRKAPVTATTGGRVAGRWRGGTMFFGGLPYAAPPTGRRRFLPPEEARPWSGVRDATRFGADAVTGFADRRAPLGLRRAPISEDCLHLNVWTQALDGARPVLVWLHGGGFAAGSGSQIPVDGAPLARGHDLVVVTINYRLGPFGWLHLGDRDDRYPASGNVGLLDQIAALRWVQANVASFGGDPTNVTLAGGSAGAMSLTSLLGLPQADGLFHKAIAQSGAGQAVVGRERADGYARDLMAALGARRVDDLLQVSAGDLASASQSVALARSLRQPWWDRRWLEFGPVDDGVTLHGDPLAAAVDPQRPTRPLLVGTNRHETANDDQGLLLAEVARWLEGLLGDRADRALEFYRADASDGRPSTIFDAIETDRRFRIPALRLAEAHHSRRDASTFLYRFDWGRPDESFGARHTLEVPFVFGVLEPWRLGPSCIVTGFDPPRPLAERMGGAWASFARSGAPATGGDWPAWDPAGGRAAMVFDEDSHVVASLDDERLALWDGVG